MPNTGLELRREVQGPKSDRLQRTITELDPQVAQWVDEFVFGAVWTRPGASRDDRMLVAIAALATTRSWDQLRAYLWGALHNGMSARRIHEALTMLTVYAGFPTALQALGLWQQVADAARTAGLDVDLPSFAGGGEG